MIARLKIVKQLLEFPEDLDDICFQLSKFSYDYDGECVVLTKQHFVSALESFVNGDKSEEEIERWANLIECREDIYFQESDEELIDATLHKLANPELQGPLTNSYCKQFLSQHSCGS